MTLTLAILFLTISYFKPPIDGTTAKFLYILSTVVWAVFLYSPAGAYLYRLKTHGLILKELIWALGKSYLAFTAVIFFLDIELSAKILLSFFAANAILIAAFRFALFAFLNSYRIRGRSYRNMIIIGTGDAAKKVADRICDNPRWGINILGFLDYQRHGLWSYREVPFIGHPDGLGELIAQNQVDFIIVAVENRDLPLTSHAFSISEEMGVTVCLLSDIYFHPISKASPTDFIDFPAVVYTSTPDNYGQLALKSLIDRIGGVIGLIMAIPLGFLTALAIKLEDGGPIFFKQIRSGRNGKPFTMYKFRTMVTGADKLKKKLMKQNQMSGPVFKMARDPRITKIGGFLRKLSIDELPQFINVMKGDMSLVGPRPPLPAEVIQYDRWQRRKLSVKPGLTCLWQVNGRNHVDFEDWMKLDLEYIDNWSLWLDTKILIKTVPAVFKGSGAS